MALGMHLSLVFPMSCSLGHHEGGAGAPHTQWHKELLFPPPLGAISPTCLPALPEPVAAPDGAMCMHVHKSYHPWFWCNLKTRSYSSSEYSVFHNFCGPWLSFIYYIILQKQRKIKKKISNSPKRCITQQKNCLLCVKNQGCFQVREVHWKKCCGSVNLLGEKHRPLVSSS